MLFVIIKDGPSPYVMRFCVNDNSDISSLKTDSRVSCEILTVRIFDWTAIFGASYSGLKAVRWPEATVTVAVTEAVAHTVTITIVRARFTIGHGRSQVRYRHALLIHTHLDNTKKP